MFVVALYIIVALAPVASNCESRVEGENSKETTQGVTGESRADERNPLKSDSAFNCPLDTRDAQPILSYRSFARFLVSSRNPP
jgi:hypothetical protein